MHSQMIGKLNILLARRTHREGVALVYMSVMMAVLVVLASLAVDFGHAQLVKMQMERAADASARYAALGLTDSTYAAKGIAAANDNYVDGQKLAITSSSVQCGVWNSATNTFTPTSVNPKAVHVTLSLKSANGNALLTPFASAMGFKSIDINATSIASITLGVNTTINVSGLSCPWLAGEPNGTTANYTNMGWVDSAPNNSPALATGVTITPGNVLNFHFNGSISNYGGTNYFGCDGNTGWIINDYAANGVSEHGIADVKAPICSIIGVFLDGNVPDGTAAPSVLDFTTSASRDFATLSPALKQPFYIGDGLRADGVTLQNFVVPTGATRLYIGIMDGQQWSDNSGAGSMVINTPPTICTVK
jgi:Flp pilus assembly protein TadG